MYVCKCMYVYVCMYVCMYVCVCVCVLFVCTYVCNPLFHRIYILITEPWVSHPRKVNGFKIEDFKHYYVMTTMITFLT